MNFTGNQIKILTLILIALLSTGCATTYQYTPLDTSDPKLVFGRNDDKSFRKATGPSSNFKIAFANNDLELCSQKFDRVKDEVSVPQNKKVAINVLATFYTSICTPPAVVFEPKANYTYFIDTVRVAMNRCKIVVNQQINEGAETEVAPNVFNCTK